MEQKFVKIQEIVLYNIARSLKLCNVNDLIELTGNALNKKQIIRAIDHLKNRRLIIKNRKNKNISVKLNFKKIERIKEIIGEHWENNWEEQWKEIGGKYVI